MPESDGSSPRLDRIERQLEKLGEISAGLITHPELLTRGSRSFGSLRETNASVRSLVGAIRDLVDRIPPENLR